MVGSDKMSKMSRKRKDSNKEMATPLEEEEVADFPRGGRSLLSRSEVQEAREEADQEFFAEMKQKRRKKDKSETDDVLSGVTSKVPQFIHTLSAKSLAVGMKFWGVITEVNKKDLAVCLPGGFNGVVIADEAIDPIAQKCGKFSLTEMFTVGKLVACVICKLESEDRTEDVKDSIKIWLSLRLSLLYKGLTIDAVQDGMMMPAYIKSIEDHGSVLSFGLPSMSGFLPSDTDEQLKEGMLVQGVVTNVNKETALITMKSDRKLLSNSVVEDHRGLSVDLLIPGVMVNARVQAIMHNGLLLSFLTYFTGTVDIFHLQDSFPGSKWNEKFHENARLKARILYVNPITKAIGLTLNPYLLQNHNPPMRVQVGDIFDKAKIVRVDHGIGLLVELPSKPGSTPGYVNINDVSDDHVEKLEKKFKEGNKVTARVLGCKHADGIVTATLKASLLGESVFNYSDVKPGMCIKAKVAKLESEGAIVRFANGLKALCPLNHMSEFEISKPRKKFQVGAEFKFRVLGCKGKRVTVTHKKTMVTSKLKILASYEDASQELITHGWIERLTNDGCFVKFYNGVKGFAPRSELGIEPGKDLESVFHCGQVVRCRIIKSDFKARRLELSFIISSARKSQANVPSALDIKVGIKSPANVPSALDIKVGDIVSGVVDSISSSTISVHVALENNQSLIGIIPSMHLSDNPGHLEQIKSLLKPGCKFDNLLVLDIASEKPKLSAKFSLIESSKSFPSGVIELKRQSVYQGYISNIIDGGIFVTFLGNITGFVSRSRGLDDFNKDFKCLYIGQSVRVKVVEVDQETGKFKLSMEQSDCYSTDASLLQGYFLEEEMIASLRAVDSSTTDENWAKDFIIGNCVEGEVQQIKEYGVIVNIRENADVVGLITHYQLGGAKVEAGNIVKACIIDLVKSDGIIDLSLRVELVKHKEKSRDAKAKNKKRKTLGLSGLQLHQNVTAVVELVKDDYMVVSLPEHDNAIGFASTRDYNLWLDPHKHYNVGQRINATVAMLPTESISKRILLLPSYLSDFKGISKPKRAKLLHSEYKIGSLIEVEVFQINALNLKVKLGSDAYGRIHITEVNDQYKEGNPLGNFKIGQKLMARVVPSPDEGVLDLSIKPSVIEAAEMEYRPAPEHYSAGLTTVAFVKSVIKDWVFLVVSRSMEGRIFILDSSSEPSALESFERRFVPGQAVFCHICNVNMERKMLELSLRRMQSYHHSESAYIECLDGGMDNFFDGKSINDIVEGDIIGGRVSNILPGVNGIKVQVGIKKYGRVHFMELCDDFPENPLEGFKEGDFVRCKVLKVRNASKGNSLIDLSLRGLERRNEKTKGNDINALEDADKYPFDSIKDLAPGMEVKGYVKNVCSKGCFIALSQQIDARIPLNTFPDTTLTDLVEQYPVGKLVKGRILRVDCSSSRVEMTLSNKDIIARNKRHQRETSAKNENIDKNLERQVVPGKLDGAADELKEGSIVDGRIKKICPGIDGLIIRLGKGRCGRVQFAELTDDFPENPVEGFKKGSIVRCRVLELKNSSSTENHVELSLRKLRKGHGEVTGKNGAICNYDSVSAPVYGIDDIVPGMLVKGYVKGIFQNLLYVMLSANLDATVDIDNLPDNFSDIDDAVEIYSAGKLVSGRITSVKHDTGKVTMTLKTDSSVRKQDMDLFHIGDTVLGIVKRIENNGVHVDIENSNKEGFCKKKNLSDQKINNIFNEYFIGQKVRAKVLQVKEGEKKCCLLLGMKNSFLSNEKGVNQNGYQELHETDFLDTWDAASECKSNTSICPLEVHLDTEAVNTAAGETNGSSDIETSGLVDKKANKRLKKRLKEERELEISAAERRRLEGDKAPESVDEYEQWVRSSPNSSYVWIKYMAYLLSLTEIDKAREVAERALQTINFREEDEKLNVWVAYLNLENAYGSPREEAVLKVFKRALQYCEPKKVHLALLGMYERTDQQEMAEQLLKGMSKKFKPSCKVWLRYLQNLLKQGTENIKVIMNRALASLPRHKHIKFITHAAILEFKIGSVERGRSQFEGVLGNYPKRTDLWSVYLDQEIGKGDLTVIRTLFERVTCLDLPPKKMKFLFKKYLDFEISHGDESKIEYVKQKAMEFVDRKAG